MTGTILRLPDWVWQRKWRLTSPTSSRVSSIWACKRISRLTLPRSTDESMRVVSRWCKEETRALTRSISWSLHRVNLSWKCLSLKKKWLWTRMSSLWAPQMRIASRLLVTWAVRSHSMWSMLARCRLRHKEVALIARWLLATSEATEMLSNLMRKAKPSLRLSIIDTKVKSSRLTLKSDHRSWLMRYGPVKIVACRISLYFKFRNRKSCQKNSTSLTKILSLYRDKRVVRKDRLAWQLLELRARIENRIQHRRQRRTLRSSHSSGTTLWRAPSKRRPSWSTEMCDTLSHRIKRSSLSCLQSSVASRSYRLSFQRKYRSTIVRMVWAVTNKKHRSRLMAHWQPLTNSSQKARLCQTTSWLTIDTQSSQRRSYSRWQSICATHRLPWKALKTIQWL